MLDSTFWIAAALGLPVALWPGIFSRRYIRRKSFELEEISSSFEGINKAYLRFGLLSIFVIFAILFPLGYLIISKGFDFKSHFIAIAVFLSSLLTIPNGLFTIKYGVYPLSKYYGYKTVYAYDEYSVMKRFGWLQIYVSGGIGILSIIYVLVRMLLSLR